ncbi:MAG TPA: hypothetical protein VL242_13305, partial [Sorangium sp.]|nr:hypothetical protein [Sorangium sp.]
APAPAAREAAPGAAAPMATRAAGAQRARPAARAGGALTSSPVKAQRPLARPRRRALGPLLARGALLLALLVLCVAGCYLAARG